MLGPHSSLGVTPLPRSLAKNQEPVTCVKLTGQLLAPARPPDLHSIAHLAGACHSAGMSSALTVLLYQRPGLKKVLPVGARPPTWRT